MFTDAQIENLIRGFLHFRSNGVTEEEIAEFIEKVAVEYTALMSLQMGIDGVLLMGTGLDGEFCFQTIPEDAPCSTPA